ncbi:MAG TPA: ATP-binding protein, partial [Longimicrobiaceae bacterium]
MTPPTHRIGDEELLGRLSRARDLPEALSILFASVLEPEGIERALVLVEDGQELRGMLAIGWDHGVARRIVVSLQDTMHPLVQAYRAVGASEIEFDPQVNGGSAGRYQVFPLGGAANPGDRFAALLIGPSPLPFPQAEALTSQLAAVGGLLERFAELDRLREGREQVEQQRDLLTTIVNALPDPVLITDAENNILLENRRAEALFTTAEGDSDGRRRAVEINNLLFSSFLTRSSIAGADENSRELNLVDPTEGGDLLFEILTTPLPSSLIGDKAMVSVLRDVTDLKRATTELEHQFKRLRQAELKARRERDRLNMILENVGDPILVTDDQSNIILMNREAERLFEAPAQSDLNSKVRQDVRTNDTKFSSFISDFALSPDSARTMPMSLTEPDGGREFPAEVVSGKVLNERSEMAAIVSVVHDLTKVAENERLATELSGLNENLEDRIRAATEELEERNRQLQWQSQELERAYRLKSQFLASMSHELRTPINALLGYTSLMRDKIYGELNQRQDEALTRMYTASQHLLELVNDILDLAKIEAGKMPVHVEPVDIGQLVRELSQTIEPMVRRKSLEYRVELAPEMPVLETDRTKVKQIVLNLLSNAVKFTPPHGRIEIMLEHGAPGALSCAALPIEGLAPGDWIALSVSDTGIGIPPEEHARIWSEFYQIDGSTTRQYSGTGLGLTIVRRLSELMGGRVGLQSIVNEGSTFTIWLPVSRMPD